MEQSCAALLSHSLVASVNRHRGVGYALLRRVGELLVAERNAVKCDAIPKNDHESLRNEENNHLRLMDALSLPTNRI